MSKKIGFIEILTTKIIRRTYTVGFREGHSVLNIIRDLEKVPQGARLVEVDPADESSDITQLTFVDESETSDE